MPELIRSYIRNVLIGWALAAVFTGLLIGLNFANLRHLVFSVNGGWIAALMLFAGNAVVFAGVQFAVVIMAMGRKEPPTGGGRQLLPLPSAQLTPQAVPARSGRR